MDNTKNMMEIEVDNKNGIVIFRNVEIIEHSTEAIIGLGSCNGCNCRYNQLVMSRLIEGIHTL